MTVTALILNLAMSLSATVVLVATAAVVLRAGPDPPNGDGRADWRGPFRLTLAGRPT
jgi:hypothetical protein